MQEQKLELIDIYDIEYAPWWLSGWLYTLCSVVFFVIVFAVAYWLYKKYKKQPPVPYWQQALSAITVLEKQDTDDGQLFYLKLTEILKKYLQERYQTALVDKTDTELLEALQKNHYTSEFVYGQVKAILDGVMFIKFAHQQAVHEQMKQAAFQSKRLIETTCEDKKTLS